jgi:Ser/Thr protein kinase RdoA (MazF antagonist)
MPLPIGQSACMNDDVQAATIHRPAGPNPAFVQRLLRYLERHRFRAAPRLHGVDENGWLVLSFVEGFVAPDNSVTRWEVEQIEAAFRLLRRYHDITAGCPLAGNAEVVCHNDFTPQNVVFRDDAFISVIDWEWAAPGSRQRDLAHAIWQWLNLGPDGPSVDDQAHMIRRVLGAYGFPTDVSILTEIEAREVEWLNLAATAARADADTFDRTPAHWADTAAWVTGELDWLRSHASQLATAMQTARE